MITLENLDRASIRQLAEKEAEELLKIAREGGNVYQKSLDQKDEIEAFVNTLSPDDQARFHSIYTEEVDACTNKTIDRTNNLIAIKNESDSFQKEIAGIAFAVLVALIIFMYLKR